MVEMSVVVAVFNEESVLADFAEKAAASLDAIIGRNKWQFVFCDNGSVDRTPEIIREQIIRFPGSKALRLPYPDVGEARCQGILQADADHILIVPVDWWDDVFLAWAWLNRDLYDLVIGSKRGDPKLNHQPLFRRGLSWGLNTLLYLMFKSVGTDTHGPKLMNTATLRPIVEQTIMRRGQFDTELTLRAIYQGLGVAEIPIPIREKRKHRNPMVKKILQNIADLRRMKTALRNAQSNKNINYQKISREKARQAIIDSGIPVDTQEIQEVHRG
jgi:glycosyltransferase involved in cell wall biosynthesis